MGADGEGHVSIFEVRCVRGDSPQEGDFVTAYDTGFGLMCVGVGSEVVVVVSRRVIWNLFFFFFSVFKSSGRVVHTVGRVYTSALRSSCVGIIVSRVIYDFVAYCRHAA